MANQENIARLKIAFQKIFDKSQNVIKAEKDFSEEELRSYFIDLGILKLLGYEDIGKDIRLEKNVEGKRVDIYCIDEYGNIIFVIEFKKPTEQNLNEHFNQLWKSYVLPLRANYGILINGLQLILYKRVRVNYELILDISLDNILENNIEEIFNKLEKEVWSLERRKELRRKDIKDYLRRFREKEDRISLKEDIAKEYFFENFSLEKDTLFEELVKKTIKLFEYYLELSKTKKKDLQFFNNAFEFWKTSYAKKPDKVPKSWKFLIENANLKESEDDLYKFMFCLETSYALLTRLIVAKACSDFKFPHVNIQDIIERKLERVRDIIPTVSWGILIKALTEEMRNNLVESIFEEDIYYWWTDRFEIGKQSWNDFIELTKEEQKLLDFSKCLKNIILTLYKYDFSDLTEVKGDLIGDLYQKYFDRETRKALGEFYTPKEVVEYILNAVGYEGEFIKEKRLIDPSCGSGTFLVDALNRYLQSINKKADKEGWDLALRDLVNSYKIVGLDIHPFACIMAQIHFMLILLPYYHKALEKDANFSLKRIPIFRTDSLIDERKSEKVSVFSFENEGKAIFVKITLPIKENGNFKSIEIKIPSKEEIFKNKLLNNTEEYFCSLQAIFDSVKKTARMKEKEGENEEWKIDRNMLKKDLKNYLNEKDFEKLAEYFLSYANDYLNEIENLRYKFGDGRLVKSIEDVVLASLLKNYVEYDFVVGNPPYVRVQRLTDDAKKYWEKTYENVYGSFDIYILFIEKAIKWLKEDGKFGYIVSGKFMNADYGRYLRVYIPKNCTIEQILDFRGSKVFRDATNDPIILTFKKGISEDNEIIFLRTIEDFEEQTEKGIGKMLEHIKKNIGKEYSDKYIQTYKIKQSKLMKEVKIEDGKEFGSEWRLESSHITSVFSKIDKISTHKLGDFGKPHRCLYTGLNNAYIVNEDEIQKYNIEKELLKPIIKGEDIRRWQITWNRLYIIYPYKKSDKGIETVDLDKYPNIKNHLLKWKSELMNRWYIIKKKEEKEKRWFEFADPRSFEQFENLKIITPDISTTNNFAIDDNGFYSINTAYTINLEKLDIDIYYLLGLLNSKTLEFYFKQIASSLGKSGFRYISQFLSKLPIIIPTNSSKQSLANFISQKVQKILSLVKIQQKTEKFPEAYLEKYISQGKETTIKEIKLKKNYKNLIPKIENRILKGFNIIISEKEDVIEIETEFQKDYVFNTLNGRNFHKDDIIKLQIPKDDAVVKEILKEFNEDKNQLEKEPIEKYENEINEMVYSLYGLNEEDKKVIEEFLGKFEKE